MRYTPVELRHVSLGRSLFGYRRRDVDKLLEDVADSYEEVWRERGELTDRLEDTDKRLGEFKDREQLLASTLVSAEKAAAEAKDAARREAELILAEANGEARSIARTAQGEKERLFAEARRVEALLRAALGMVEETKGAEQLAVESGESGAWPVHEDTSEFEAILSPGAAAAVREPSELAPGPAEPEPVEEHEHELEDVHEFEPGHRVSLPPVNDEGDERYGGV
ncbi:MAG TPA: DivIVA domain-containing protein [Gaiellaceae bacterium]|nr:DivIVA domain-containing protein [Gaiellaceae bacterium]